MSQHTMAHSRTLNFPVLRARLRSGEALLGTFCELPCPEALEIIGLSGWDFAVLDCEHAPITAAQLPGMVRAASAASLPAIVRVASNDPAAIQHALDSGAAGVQIPQIASLAAARAAVSAARFAPSGMRGFNPFVRAASFSAQAMPEFLRRANEEVSLVLQIESAAGLECAAEIAAIEGVDCIFVGPYDLSQSLGIPGQTAHPKVLAAAERIAAAAARYEVATGVFTASEIEARQWIERGLRYVCCSVDTVTLFEAMRGLVSRLRA